jgi:toxin ParE1/3/4
MKIIIREEAEDDLGGIYQWIANDNPRAARDTIARIRERINLLELNALAHMGRPGFVPGTLELVEYPYVIVYRILASQREIEVLAIVHGARERK